jgi:Uma2 family endonuclease
MAAPTTLLVALDSGDRLTREEFHRRYEARPDIKRAELVEGVVYVPSPTRFDLHDEPALMMGAWLATYATKHPGVRAGGSPTILLDERNEVRPDALLFRPDPTGAGPHITAEHYIEGAPQLIVEVAASSVAYDLHDKKEAYRRNGVLEYLVQHPPDEAFDWFRLEAGEYARVEPDEGGVIESAVFPGLRLNVAKLLAGDLAGVLAELETR